MRLIAAITLWLAAGTALAEGIPMPATPIGEIPPERAVMIRGIVVSAGSSYFVLNDGGASIIVSAGPGWRTLTVIGEGDRAEVVGRIDRFGSGMFMAASIATTDGRIVSVKPYR